MTCLLSFRPEGEHYKVLLLANRDDYFDRVMVLPHRWNDTPEIKAAGVYAPRLLSDANTCTWMGVTKRGRFAVMTFVRTQAELFNLKSQLRLGRDPLSGNAMHTRKRVVKSTDRAAPPPDPKEEISQASLSGSSHGPTTRRKSLAASKHRKSVVSDADWGTTCRTSSTLRSGVEKCRAPNSDATFTSSLYIPRTLLLVHKDDAPSSKLPDFSEEVIANVPVISVGGSPEKDDVPHISVGDGPSRSASSLGSPLTQDAGSPSSSFFSERSSVAVVPNPGLGAIDSMQIHGAAPDQADLEGSLKQRSSFTIPKIQTELGDPQPATAGPAAVGVWEDWDTPRGPF
eukprot:RCo027131